MTRVPSTSFIIRWPPEIQLKWISSTASPTGGTLVFQLPQGIA